MPARRPGRKRHELEPPSPDCTTAEDAHHRRPDHSVRLSARASVIQVARLESSALQRPHRHLQGPHAPWPPAEDPHPTRQPRLSGHSGPGGPSNPHRPGTCDRHPAGSFPGGFRTPAPVDLAASVMAGIRNPTPLQWNRQIPVVRERANFRPQVPFPERVPDARPRCIPG